MTDQASTLRNLMQPPQPVKLAGWQPKSTGKVSLRGRTIAVTSGKGGVGKTNLVVNLALEMAALGKQVTLFDADLGLANADVLLGLNPEAHIGHVVGGQKSLNEIIIEVAPRFRLIPASSGLDDLANLARSRHTKLVQELEQLEERTDYLLIDTAAGIADNVMGILRAAAEVVVVTMPEPTALIDAYATIKVLHKYEPFKPVSIVVNKTVGLRDADEVFFQLQMVTRQFLNHPITFLGSIPFDPAFSESALERMPVTRFTPNNPASRSFRLIAKNLEGTPRPPLPGTPSFWQRLTL